MSAAHTSPPARLPEIDMNFSLMPTDPEARREAEEHLRNFAGILLLCLIFGALINLTLFAQDFWVALAINLSPVAVALCAYVNARLGYRWVSSNAQLILVLIFMAGGVTFLLHLYGSTSTPHIGFYIIFITATTVYISPKAGTFGFLLMTGCYGVLLGLEHRGLIEYAALYPEKAAILEISDYTQGMFILVVALNTTSYATSFYIARSLRQKKETIQEANRRLVALDEAKNRFLGVVSHDLRTPITSIKAYGELIEENSEGENQQFARVIVQEGDRLHRLVTDLLDLDKMEAGKMEWTLKRQDLQPVLENAAAVFSAAAQDKNITLAKEIAADLPEVKIDADRFAQLVANLLSNAIKFTPEGGTVTLRTWSGARGLNPLSVHGPANIPLSLPEGEGWGEGVALQHSTLPRLRVPLAPPSLPGRGGTGPSTFVRVSVQDTGLGIPRDDLERIFDRFSQTETGKREGAGTGLGLAIAKEITTAHGGTLSVDSIVGEGTTFTVTIPAA